MIHSTEHVDFDAHEPTLTVDGVLIFDGEKFYDEEIIKHAAEWND